MQNNLIMAFMFIKKLKDVNIQSLTMKHTLKIVYKRKIQGPNGRNNR